MHGMTQGLPGREACVIRWGFGCKVWHLESSVVGKEAEASCERLPMQQARRPRDLALGRPGTAWQIRDRPGYQMRIVCMHETPAFVLAPSCDALSRTLGFSVFLLVHFSVFPLFRFAVLSEPSAPVRYI